MIKQCPNQRESLRGVNAHLEHSFSERLRHIIRKVCDLNKGKIFNKQKISCSYHISL
ncbi:MAG TPA: hypothetical protein PK657_06740 [Legionella sp.]|nr:hypothetical protein [Legionella sp.]